MNNIEVRVDARRSNSLGTDLQSFGSSIVEGIKKTFVYIGRLSSDSLFVMRVCQLAVNIISIGRLATSNATLGKVPVQKLTHTAIVFDLFGGLDPFSYFLSGKHIEKGASSVESLKQGAFLISGGSALVAFICEIASQALTSVALLAVKVASGFAIIGFACSGYQAIKEIRGSKNSSIQTQYGFQLVSNISGFALGVIGVIGVSSLAAVLTLGTLCSGFGILNQLIAVRNKEQQIT